MPALQDPHDNVLDEPDFKRRIVEKYLSAQSNVFLLFGAVRDVYPTAEGQYASLTDFLIESVIKPRRPDFPRIVVMYDPVQGIVFVNPADRILVAKELGEERLSRILTRSKADIVDALAFLREFTRLKIMITSGDDQQKKIRKDFAFIIKHGEAVAPPSRGDVMLDSDRLKVINLENWFSDGSFVASSDIVFLLCETLSGLNERIVDLPFCATIRIDRPNEEERRTYVEWLNKSEGVSSSVSPEQIAFSSAGLTLLSIRQIFRQASFHDKTVTPELVFEKTKEIIEKELEGHIEFPSLGYGFEKVIGARRLLKKLNELKTCLLGHNPDIMPVGILVPGPNGVGKTFIYKAFAKECGWVAVVLKNIRGPYVGETERNWERIKSVLEAMGSVMVIYDEADTEIGGRSAQTHEVDRRLFGNILKMMSDQANRGKIVWVIITARPDRLEPDIKRSGRAGEHLPVFDNEGDERKAFIRHVLFGAGLDLDSFPPGILDEFLSLTESYYPSDFDQILTQLKRRRTLEGALTPEMVVEEVKDFIPPDVARQREYQELLAVLECTSRSLLPSRYADMPRDIVTLKAQEIRSSLGMG